MVIYILDNRETKSSIRQCVSVSYSKRKVEVFDYCIIFLGKRHSLAVSA